MTAHSRMPSLAPGVVPTQHSGVRKLACASVGLNF
jgi:hypothetical protein